MSTDLLRENIADFAKQTTGKAPQRHEAAQPNAVCTLPLTALRKSPYQPRLRALSKKDVAELSQSLAAIGQTSPIVVSSCPGEPNTYHVHQGQRRWFAAELLGWSNMAAIVKNGLDECQARKIALADNLGRDNLTAWEQAHALEQFCSVAKLSTEHAAIQLGISRPTAFRLKTLLQVSDGLKDVFGQSNIGIRPAELLARLDAKKPQRAVKLAQKLAAGEILIRAIEAELEKGGKPVRTAAVRGDVAVRVTAKGVDMHVQWHNKQVSQEHKVRIVEAVSDLFALLKIERDELLTTWKK